MGLHRGATLVVVFLAPRRRDEPVPLCGRGAAGRALLSTDRCGVSTLPPLLARLARDAFVSRGPLVGEDCEDGGPALCVVGALTVVVRCCVKVN